MSRPDVFGLSRITGLPTGDREIKKIRPSTTARPDTLKIGEKGGVIYLNPNLTNQGAIDSLFHELQHYNGVGSTREDENVIRRNQTQFMIDIGMQTMIPGAVTTTPPGGRMGGRPTVNPGAIDASIPRSYDQIWRNDPNGKWHDDSTIQKKPKEPKGIP